MLIGGDDEIFHKRIDNCIDARDRAECPDFKNYWEQVLQMLLRKYKRKMILHPEKKSIVNNPNNYLLSKDSYWYKYEAEGYKKNSVNIYLVPFNKIFPTNSYNIFRHVWTGKGWLLIGHKGE
jgi:hypothetical protein